MATVQNNRRLVLTYLVFYVGFYFVATVLTALYVQFLSGDQSGAGVGLLIALPLMFIITSVAYFFVPGSAFAAIYLLRNFVLRQRGSKLVSILASLAFAVGIWLATYPLAVSLINLFYAGNDFMMVKDSSWPFIYLEAGTNLAGLIAAVLWVKLKPVKAKQY